MLYLIFSLLFLVQAAFTAPLARRLYQPSSPVFTLLAYHKGKEFQYHLVKFNGVDLELARDEPAFFGRVKASTGYTLNIPFGTYPPYEQNLAKNITQHFPLGDSVYVNENGKLTTLPWAASPGFAVNHSALTYRNSSLFMACPVYTNLTTTQMPNNTTGTLYEPPMNAKWPTNTNSTMWSSNNATGPPIPQPNWSVPNDWQIFSESLGYADAQESDRATIIEAWLKRYTTYQIYTGTSCPDYVPGYNITLYVEIAASVQYDEDSNKDAILQERINKRFW